MANMRESIINIVREQLDNLDISMTIDSLTGKRIITAKLPNNMKSTKTESSGDHDFNPNDSGPFITSAVAGKAVKDVIIDNEGMDDYLVFNFTDGTSLRIRYDYIYEWSLAASE